MTKAVALARTLVRDPAENLRSLIVMASAVALILAERAFPLG
jgi:hypothetical protein